MTDTRIAKIEKFISANGSTVFQLVEETTGEYVRRLDPRNPTPEELEDASDQFAAVQQSRITELEAANVTLQTERDEAVAVVESLESTIAARDATIAELTAEPEVAIITPRQAKLALFAADLLDDVETIVNAADRTIQIHYYDATQWRRDDPVLIGLAGQLGLTGDQLDDLFAAGAAI